MSKQKRPISEQQGRKYFQNTQYKTKLTEYLKKNYSIDHITKVSNMSFNDNSRTIRPQVARMAKEKLYNEKIPTLNEVIEQNIRSQQKHYLNQLIKIQKEEQEQNRRLKLHDDYHRKFIQNEQIRKNMQRNKQNNYLQRKIQKSYNSLLQPTINNKSQALLKGHFTKEDYKSNQIINKKLNQINEEQIKNRSLLIDNFHGQVSSSEIKISKQIQPIYLSNLKQRQQILQIKTLNEQLNLKNRRLSLQQIELKNTIQILQIQLKKDGELFEKFEDEMKKIKAQYSQVKQKLQKKQRQSPRITLLAEKQANENKVKLQMELQQQRQNKTVIESYYVKTKAKLQRELQQEKRNYLDFQKTISEILKKLQHQIEQKKQDRVTYQNQFAKNKSKLENQLLNQQQNIQSLIKQFNQTQSTLKAQLQQSKLKRSQLQKNKKEILSQIKYQLQQEELKHLFIENQSNENMSQLKQKLKKQKQNITQIERKYLQIKQKLQQQLLVQEERKLQLQKQLNKIKDQQKPDIQEQNQPRKKLQRTISIIRNKEPDAEGQQQINEFSVKADIKEILTYRMIDNHLTRAQIIERINSSFLTRLTYAKLFSMLTAYPFSLTPYYAVEFLKSCFGYAKIPQNAQIKKQDFIKSIEEFVQDFQLRDTAEVEKMLKEIGQFIVQNRKPLQERFSVAGAKDKCIDKQTLIKHLREVGNFSDDKARLVISRMSSKCEYLDKINYQQLFYEFDVNNSFKITKYMKELLTYRMKYNRLTFQQLKTSIKDKKFTFGQLQAILREYPFKLSADYAKEFLKAIYHKQQNITDQTFVDVNIFINYLSYVVEDFQLPTEQQQRQQIQTIAEIMFKNRYSLENQFQYLRAPEVADKMQKFNKVNSGRKQDNGDINSILEKSFNKTVTKLEMILVLQNINLTSSQIQLTLCRLAAKCEDFNKINYNELQNFFKQFNIYLWSPKIKEIRQIITYRMKYYQLNFSQLRQDIQKSNYKKFLYKDLLTAFQLDPFRLSLTLAEQFLRICYGKQSIIYNEQIYPENLVSHLRNVIDYSQESPIEADKETEILSKISKIITDNEQKISDSFKQRNNKYINKKQLEQILYPYLHDKTQIQLFVCHLSMRCQSLCQITYQSLFDKSAKVLPKQHIQNQQKAIQNGEMTNPLVFDDDNQIVK